LRLYDYPASANCYKVRLLLALLGRDYERVPVDIFAGDTLTADYARLNPARETPVLELDDGSRLAQSNAILWYLAAGSRHLPNGELEQAHILQWLFFEQERVMSGIGSARFRTLTTRQPEQLRGRLELGKTALEMLQAHLRDRVFLVGQACTIADISNYAYTHVAGDAGYDLRTYPAIVAWLARVRAEPGFVDDLTPYPENASPGLGRSIYE